MGKKKRHYIYKPKEISVEKYITEQFKTKLSEEEHDYSKVDFKNKLGESHPFDYKVIEGLEMKFGIVSAIEDKICDYTIAPGLFIECEDDETKTYLENWIVETNLIQHLRPWLKSGLGKGSGYLEIAGLSDIEEKEFIKNIDSNTIFVQRDDTGVVINYNQYVGANIKIISDKKIIELDKDNIIQLNINQVGNNAYGMGIVFSGIPIINDFLNAQSALHTIMRRKANSQIHVKLGNAEKDDYPTQNDINDFGSNLQYMNESTEWVTGPNCEMNVLDFGNVGEKFKSILDNDMKLLSYAFQVPESILGADKGFVGSAEIQEEGFDKNIKSYQEQIGYILKEKVFDILLLQKGKEKVKYKVVWGKQTESEKNSIRTTYISLLSSSCAISPGLKRAYEKKIALLDGIDFIEVEKENDKAMRRNNIDSKKSFNRQVQLQQIPGQQNTDEHYLDHEILDEYFKDLAPQEIEIELAKKYTDENLYNKITEVIDDFNKDYNLNEWIGEYTEMSDDIDSFIDEDDFINLSAVNAQEVALGMLTASQIKKLKFIMKDAVKNNRSLHYITVQIEGLHLPDRYVINSKGEKVLSISSKKRAAMIARTETVRIRAEGSLRFLKKGGTNEVVFRTTSGKPCPLCQSMEGGVFKIEEASGIIPLHANCVCQWEKK